MSSTRKRRLTAILIVAGTVVFLALVHWISDPAPSPASPTDDGGLRIVKRDVPPNPPASIVFVIDGSKSMFPPTGPSYFDLACEGIADLLEKPGFPSDGSFEIAVLQHTKRDAFEYNVDEHWLPLRVITEDNLADTATIVANLQRSGHASSSLMEMGVREAMDVLLNEASYPIKHIIWLATGEYRIPTPCPPDCYTRALDDSCPTGHCESPSGPHTASMNPFCNRACFVRHFANEARTAGITVSTLRLGPDWHNTLRWDSYNEPDDPYGDPPDYCATPTQPDRDGFLKELANWDDADGTVPCQGAPQLLGKNARVNPFYCFGCGIEDFTPGTARDVSTVLASWLCDWGLSPNSDTDTLGDVCDNCPYYPNEDQRDCNEDGVGDVCQFIDPEACGDVPADSDNDGLCDLLDGCPGGDDCLVAQWASAAGCPIDVPLQDCGCDCDHNGEADLCQAAAELAGTPDTDGDGIPDRCEEDAPNCDADPASCDCDAVPDACDLLYLGGYTETFDDFPADTSINDAYGWTVSYGANPFAASIVEESDRGQVLTLALDTTQGDDPYPYYVEAIGFAGEGSPCDPQPDGCTGEADPGPWGVVEISIDLFIDNDLDGPPYDLYILDPCVDDFEESKRVHLRFEDDPHRGDGGYIWYGGTTNCSLTYYPWIRDGMHQIGIYPTGQWFTLYIEINSQRHYDMDSGECFWTGNGDSVYLDVDGPSPASICSSTCYELGATRPFANRGIQLRLVHDNRPCRCANSTVDQGDWDDWNWRLLCPDRDLYPDCESCRSHPNVDAWVAEHCPPPLPGHPPRDLCWDCPITDCRDNCPHVNNPWQIDSDGDGWGDACDGFGIPNDIDSDEDDGIYDKLDNCPKVYNPRVPYVPGSSPCEDELGLVEGDLWQPDSDCDGVGDACDNCPDTPNPAQTNSDNDSQGGDACDPSPNTWNGDLDPDCLPDDGDGNVFCDCDYDSDKDYIYCGGIREDNCPFDRNYDQADADGDGYGDDCDNCENVKNDQIDADRDGYGDACDPCPYTSSGSTADYDYDGVGTYCDNCRYKFNPQQLDYNHDNVGDACDPELDSDDDGILNEDDNCPYIANPGQGDADGDEIGDACEYCYNVTPGSADDVDCDRVHDGCDAQVLALDSDGDGVTDACDNCPGAPNNDQADTDGDSVGDECDNCPADDNTGQEDMDADGVGDACDECQRGAGVTADGCNDCNDNGIIDPLEFADCTPGTIGCDCNQNGVPDDCDIASGESYDFGWCAPDENGVPDECELFDCDCNGIPDVDEGMNDCNANGIADECDWYLDLDCDYNGVPDECEEADCNENGVFDWCESTNCNNNDIPDICEELADCNGNGYPDICWDLLKDCDYNGIIDNCQVATCYGNPSCLCSQTPYGCSTYGCGGGATAKTRSLPPLDQCEGPCGTGYSCVDEIRVDNIVIRELTPCEWRSGECDPGEECTCLWDGFQCR